MSRIIINLIHNAITNRCCTIISRMSVAFPCFEKVFAIDVLISFTKSVIPGISLIVMVIRSSFTVCLIILSHVHVKLILC